MPLLSSPITKEDFINSGWQNEVNRSTRKDCSGYSIAFSKDAIEANRVGKVRAQTVVSKPRNEDLAFSKIRCFLPKSVFLKTPERIAALATIVGLSLMVYTLAQRQLRQALAAANETVPDQRKRPTQTPTLRLIFQGFQAIHLVWLNGQAQISNLSPERLKILRFFGTPCLKYYLLC